VPWVHRVSSSTARSATFSTGCRLFDAIEAHHYHVIGYQAPSPEPPPEFPCQALKLCPMYISLLLFANLPYHNARLTLSMSRSVPARLVRISWLIPARNQVGSIRKVRQFSGLGRASFCQY